MVRWFTVALLATSSLGFLVLLLQRLGVAWALRARARPPRARRGVSILKPLCGVDECLEANLESFVALGYPEYEVLLGVESVDDGAYPVALRVAARWPGRFKVVVQRRAVGLNPKVNQLATLAHGARHDLLLVSDSNARLLPGALEEIVACFDDPAVACVSSPVSGTGHRSFGALLDNLHLAAGIGAGQLAAKVFLNRDFVVGKSMALEKQALRDLGGFEAWADVLAEDYALGCAVTRQLGRKVAIASIPVHNVAVERSVSSFFARYLRWSVLHRTAIPLSVYLAELLLNPWPLLVLACGLARDLRGLPLAGVGLVLKAGLDASSARALRCGSLGWRAVAAVAVKDVLLLLAWGYGLFARSVRWRGRVLHVSHGSRLVPPLRVDTGRAGTSGILGGAP